MIKLLIDYKYFVISITCYFQLQAKYKSKLINITYFKFRIKNILKSKIHKLFIYLTLSFFLIFIELIFNQET